MRLRSKVPCTLQKSTSGEKERQPESSGKSNSKKKKPQFGDGSDFRPGWEEEVYRFKRSLRMPARLINIPRPPHSHRLSASLPDLDPYPNSPAASTVDSADFMPQRHHSTRPVVLLTVVKVPGVMYIVIWLTVILILAQICQLLGTMLVG